MKPSFPTIKYGHWTFTCKECMQIVDLVEEFAHGRVQPLDRRKYTKNVVSYAVALNLAVWECPHGHHLDSFSLQCPKCGREKYRLMMIAGMSFEPVNHLPIEILAYMMRNILKPQPEYKTLSRGEIIKHSDWVNLNIYSAREKNYSDNDLQLMVDALNRLDRHGFLIFQHSGAFWVVTPTERR